MLVNVYRPTLDQVVHLLCGLITQESVTQVYVLIDLGDLAVAAAKVAALELTQVSLLIHLGDLAVAAAIAAAVEPKLVWRVRGHDLRSWGPQIMSAMM